ncbi:FAD/NAD-P-binding domain-containing protein [Mycena albidolilacea]|uniref:FAD/NAD-P-binding domain-containing protein n=1 Tax=Mycena albidolilacea TaxID=1033008 RepID=A0AAD7A6P4_9AGAR|nr:FAD/NAD-P-binding domain-containing protein [Mycena albidolilacea]
MVAFSTAHAIFLAKVTLPALAQQTFFNSWDATDPPQWTTFPHPIRRVAVIGAGPTGLQTAAELLEANLTVRLFERAPSPGGNWLYTEETAVRETYPETNSTGPEWHPHEFPATAYYEEGDDGITLDERWRKHWRPRPAWYQLRTNTPGPLTRLPGIEHAPDTPWRLSVHDVERNVRAYASLHGLNSNDRLRSPSGLPVTSYSTGCLNPVASNPSGGTEEFDAVVIATSRHNEAKVPDNKGIGNWSAATENGRYVMYHSQAFRHAEHYAGKTVLIVGASVSATQISRLVAPFTNRLLASVRPNSIRDAYGLDILFSFDEKVEVVPEISSFEPLDGNNVSVKAGKIKLINGVVLDGIDEIILATGYSTNTFLPDLVNPRTLDNLHWTGHYIDDPTLVYTHSLRPWVYGTCCHVFARVFTGKARLPSRERMRGEYDSGKYQFGTPLDVVLQEAVRKLYAGWLNSEALELGGQFIESPPIEAREMFTYFVNTHYKKDLVSHDNFTP